MLEFLVGTEAKAAIFSSALLEYEDYFFRKVHRPVRDALFMIPSGVEEYAGRLKKLIEASGSGLNSSVPGAFERTLNIELRLAYNPEEEIHDDKSLALRVLIWKRRTLAAALEVPRSKANDSEIVSALDARGAEVDSLIQSFEDNLEPCKEPSLLDYMSISNAANFTKEDMSPPDEVFDDKFGILLAASSVERDFHHFRRQCEVRRTSLAFMFVDIDDFKPFNGVYGHANVDSDLLPQFQQVLDASVYSRWRAYRQGGDEYIILLPNCAEDEVEYFAARLQSRLKDVRYRLAVESNPTVSIGYVVVTPDSVVTCREVQVHAGVCLKHVKETLGKNQCVGGRIGWDGVLVRQE